LRSLAHLPWRAVPGTTSFNEFYSVVAYGFNIDKELSIFLASRTKPEHEWINTTNFKNSLVKIRQIRGIRVKKLAIQTLSFLAAPQEPHLPGAVPEDA